MDRWCADVLCMLLWEWSSSFVQKNEKEIKERKKSLGEDLAKEDECSQYLLEGKGKLEEETMFTMITIVKFHIIIIIIIISIQFNSSTGIKVLNLV